MLLVGLGAISTTVIAGVEAVKRGLGLPIGSLTQIGTVLLCKRTENRAPEIAGFVPLAKLEDLVTSYRLQRLKICDKVPAYGYQQKEDKKK